MLNYSDYGILYKLLPFLYPFSKIPQFNEFEYKPLPRHNFSPVSCADNVGMRLVFETIKFDTASAVFSRSLYAFQLC